MGYRRAVITAIWPATERQRALATATRAGSRTAGHRRDGVTATRLGGAARQEAQAAGLRALRRNRVANQQFRTHGWLRTRRRRHIRGRRRFLIGKRRRVRRPR